MNNWLLTALCMLLGSAVTAQVTGNALLEGQIDHSGIKVKFIPVAGAAELDSAYTTATGSFSAVIVGGVYQVVHSKPGYQSFNYMNGQSFAIPPDHVLDDVELQPGSNQLVSGNTTGTWTNNNIYVVNGDIYIPAGETLEVEEGTQIRFNGFYSIIADGAFVVNGSDAQPVSIRSNKNNPTDKEWNSIQLLGEGSIIDHAIIEHCDWCVFAEEHSPIISNCTVRYCHQGIYANSTKAIIRKNHVHDFGMLDTYGWGIWVESFGSEALVECNEVHTGKGYGGIIAKRYDIVRDNHIYDIRYPNVNAGFGIAVDICCDPLIYNNFIHDCNIGIHIGSGAGGSTPNPTIHNNVISNNERAGIYFDGYSTAGIIINNIIVGNEYGLRRIYGGPGPYIVRNNLLYDTGPNFSNIGIPGLGVVVGQNVNGDDIDSYGNLVQQSPLFVTENPLTYDTLSPIFGAGDTTYYEHLGITGTRECLRVEQPEDELEEDTLNSEVLIFPNPCTEDCNVLISRSESSEFEFKLYNSMGQVVARDRFSTPNYMINRQKLSAGFYLCVLSDDLDWRSTHRIVLR